MAITRPVYATREMVKRSLDIKETARANAQIDRLLQASSDSIDGGLHRTLYPRLGTLEWDWPNPSSPTPWRLWLDDKEIISLVSVTSGGAPVSLASLILYPSEGPPYNRVEVNIGASSSFSLGSTYQNSLVLNALFGHTLSLEPIGDLVAGIDGAVRTLTVPDGSAVGVGDLLRIGDEYLLVVGRSWVDSTQNLQSSMTASAGVTTAAVTDGTAFFADEVIILDAEKMLITDVVGNNLIVKRAWDGSVLASHSGSDVYVHRSLTVTRGSVGSTAVSHLSGVTIDKWGPPPLINELCIAETLAGMEQEQSAYARVVGNSEHSFEARGVGLEDIRTRVCEKYGRKARHRAI